MQMYAKGMSQRDIEDTLRQIYGAEISQGLVSRITDKILPEVNEWQNRPLEAVYPVVFFDGIVFNSRKDNKIVTKCVYSVLGINMEGHKEILGTWISENESASFYASICSDLQSRGVKDIFIACHDNLTGLCNAINSVFPKTKNQLCIVHQIRNSCKFVPYKDRKAVCADLKKIYDAVNLDDAEFAKEEFREKWNKKYPNILKSWDKNWAELTVFFEYPQEIRKITPGCSITERLSCTSVRRRCGLCRSGFCWICGNALSSLWGLLNLNGKRILTRLCRWGFN